MSASQTLEDISAMAGNLNLTSSQEDKLFDVEMDEAPANDDMEVTVVESGSTSERTGVDTQEVLTQVSHMDDTLGYDEPTTVPNPQGDGQEVGESSEPRVLSSRTRNRARQRLLRAKKRKEERATANPEHLIPLLTPKGGREVDDTPPPPQVEGGVLRRL